MTRISLRTRARIEDAVRRIERLPVGSSGVGAGLAIGGDGYPALLVAANDIEHGAVGDAYLATGSSSANDFAQTGATRKVFNLREKIWAGSLLVAVWASRKPTSNDVAWIVTQAWSATRIRGLAAANIAPGATGTLSTLTLVNGHYAPTTASVYLPTAHVSIKSGKVVWAELVYHSTTGSRWEAYSADCDGGA